MIPKLDHPKKPALPSSYFWTWDHSTNWVLDDPGLLNFGAHNAYLKRPETFIEDYRRLTDVAADLGVKGIVIWGFLRDSHGGIEAAKRVASYAASKGVAIMPGIGTTWYGGVYYEGDNPFNIETFARKHPDARMIGPDGSAYDQGLCSSHPAFIEWLQSGMRWLFKEFEIGGVNLENGDLLVCHCPRCVAHKKDWPKDDPEFYRLQSMSYEPAIRALDARIIKDKLITYATYKGFLPGKPPAGVQGADASRPTAACEWMECERPVMLDRIPRDAIAQWTITAMTPQPPTRLIDLLDDGAPPSALSAPTWPSTTKAPAHRNTGFLHQASQWGKFFNPAVPGRYAQALAAIKQGCLLAARSGLEGVSIHGEVTSRHVPYALNYLAFSHFTHRPEDSLRQFSQTTLATVLGDEKSGETFIEVLANHDAGAVSDSMKSDIRNRCGHAIPRASYEKARADLTAFQYWNWLTQLLDGKCDPHTVGFY